MTDCVALKVGVGRKAAQEPMRSILLEAATDGCLDQIMEEVGILSSYDWRGKKMPPGAATGCYFNLE